jgi:drug/metabolite transporter (DMT)-like permease
LARKLDNSYVGTGCGVAAIVLWSTTIATARSLSEQLGPLTAGASVYLLGGFLCFGRLCLRKPAVGRFSALPRKYLVGCGGLFVIYTVFLYLAVGWAQDHAQVLEIGLVNYLWPALTILFALPLLKQRAGPLLVPGTLAALSGVVLVMFPGDGFSWRSFAGHLSNNPAAYSLALCAAISWALYSNLTRRWCAGGGAGAVELFLPATGIVLLLVRCFAVEVPKWSIQAVVETCFLATITALAYVLWDIAMRKGNVLAVAAFSYSTPLLSTLVSCAYLKVAPGSRLWKGCALIVVGSIVNWLSLSTPTEKEAPE